VFTNWFQVDECRNINKGVIGSWLQVGACALINIVLFSKML